MKLDRIVERISQVWRFGDTSDKSNILIFCVLLALSHHPDRCQF
jgi:hypothetical protein